MRKIRINFPLILLLSGILAACTTPSILVTQEQQKGDASFNVHDYQAAAGHYSAMLDASTKLGVYRNLTMEADVHRKIANCHEMLGRYPEALEHVRSAFRLDSTENNSLEMIEDICQEGMIRLYIGHYTAGTATLERALELNQGMDESLKNTNRLSIAGTYLALGRVQSALGRFEASLENLRESTRLFRLARSTEGEMESTLATGRVYADIGHLDRARSLIENSSSLAESLEMSTARHEEALARIESTLGRYENALRHQEKALELAGAYKIAGQKIWYSIGMGDIYRDIGDLERAARSYGEAEAMMDAPAMQSAGMEASLNLRAGRLNEAMDYFTGEGSLVGAGISALRLGEVNLLKNEYDTASMHYRQAACWFSRAGNQMGFARAQLHLGQIHIDRNELGAARPCLDSAAAAGVFPETQWQVWFQRGRLEEKAGRPEEARRAYEESIRIIEQIRGNFSIDEFKSIYLDNKREVYERLINLLEQMGESADAFNYSERAKARTFLDILAGKKIRFRGSEDSELIRLEQEKRFEIRNLYQLLQGSELASSSSGGTRQVDTRSVWENLRNSQEEYEEILLQIKLHHPDYSRMVNVEPIDLDEARRSIDANTAIIAYWVSAEAIHAWLISRDEFKHQQIDLNRQQLNRLIGNTRHSISSYSMAGPDPGLNELYRYLIAPLEPGIREYARLVIVPNASLHFVPFQALANEENRCLVEDFTLSYAPSTSIYQLCMEREMKAGNTFLGMALGSLSVGNFPGLPGTSEELAGIRKEFAGDQTTFLAEENTETTFKKECPNFRYIHLATHGSYNFSQPLYSFLLFNSTENDDGRLTVHEVFELSLNSNLVTLSACETGLGNLNQGDELEGLSRAFLYAGSSSVIVSLWNVADYPTSLLMARFYAYLKDHPADRALTLAQRDLLKQFPQPFFWAPFILIGNGRFSMD